MYYRPILDDLQIGWPPFHGISLEKRYDWGAGGGWGAASSGGYGGYGAESTGYGGYGAANGGYGAANGGMTGGYGAYGK